MRQIPDQLHYLFWIYSYTYWQWGHWQLGIFTWDMSWEILLMPYENNKGADQPVHPHSLISAFLLRCLDSTSHFYICNFMTLACFCSWAARFESYLVANPEDRFSRDSGSYPFQRYFSHIRTTERWLWRALCDWVVFRYEEYLIRIWRSEVGTTNCLPTWLLCNKNRQSRTDHLKALE